MKNLLLSDEVKGLKKLVVDVVNVKIEEYQISDVNSLRSKMLLLLSSDDTKREYQKTRNESLGKRNFNLDKPVFTTNDGILIPAFSVYSKAVDQMKSFMTQLDSLLKVHFFENDKSGAGY